VVLKCSFTGSQMLQNHAKPMAVRTNVCTSCSRWHAYICFALPTAIVVPSATLRNNVYPVAKRAFSCHAHTYTPLADTMYATYRSRQRALGQGAGGPGQHECQCVRARVYKLAHITPAQIQYACMHVHEYRPHHMPFRPGRTWRCRERRWDKVAAALASAHTPMSPK